MRNALFAQYRPLQSSATMRARLYSLHWTGNDMSSLISFTNEFRTLAARVPNATNDEIVYALSRSLPDNMAQEIVYRAPPNLDAAIRLVHDYQQARGFRASMLSSPNQGVCKR